MVWAFSCPCTDRRRPEGAQGRHIHHCEKNGICAAIEVSNHADKFARGGSEYVLVNGWSANGDMFGLMQIAKQWHKPMGDWDSEEHIKQGTGILTYSIGIIQNKFPKWTKEQQLKGGLAAYNAGAQNVHQYESVDENTSAKDYSNDVVGRAQFYRKHGFHV
ncbi:lysozyme g-like [Alosa alosa]|uniref:lysozyme g-like n=1 Tax=Alosa alosa TaxID=278164 RepID=UPI0020152574|nr:lysozyme g-like [Alosa alosa]